jgi:hypothetical protein
VTLSYDLDEKWSFGAVFVFATGNATTLAVSRYFIDGRITDEYLPRNSFRMPPYHRADISATYKFPKKKKWEQSLNFSVYNLYNRMNPYFLYIDTDVNLATYSVSSQAKQVSLFSILPSITYNFRF